MKPSKQTVKVIRELQAYLLAEPRRVNMDYWGISVDPEKYDKLQLADEEEVWEYNNAFLTQEPPCGAIACLAGSLCIMRGCIKPSEHFDGTYIYNFTSEFNVPVTAADILQLDIEEAKKLFYIFSWGYGAGWPTVFEDRLKANKPGTLEYVQTINERLEHYIATGE